VPELIDILKALADETRLNLIKFLLGHDYCVGALAKKLNISESAVSQHLKIMRNVGIVKGDKRGYFTHYYVERDSLKEFAMKIIELSEMTQTVSACHKCSSKNHSCCANENTVPFEKN